MFLRTGVHLSKIRPTELDSFGHTEVKCDGLLSPVKWEINRPRHVMTVTLAGKPVQAAIATNLGQVRELLTELAAGMSPYKIIRIMA
jgi:hypothetical protein